MSVALDWITKLHGNSPGYFNLVAFAGGKVKKTVWYSTSEKDIARAARTYEQYADKFDLYISVATHTQPAEYGRGTLKSTCSIPGFWADLDIGTEGHKDASLPNPETREQALSIIDGLPEPSALVHTGGGLQAWWLFETPWIYDADEISDVAKASAAWQTLLVSRAQERGYHLDSVGDLPRILRVPGTKNLKSETARSVTLANDTNTRYERGLLTSLGIYPDDEVSTEAKTDNFPLTWKEILEPHGYTFSGTDVASGGQLVVRPGKNKSEGHSGVIDPYGVPVLVNYSASDPTLPSGPGKRLTKLRVWALLNYDGDVKRARQALKQLFKDTPEQLNQLAARFESYKLDFTTIWTEEDPEPDWMVEPLIEHGRQVAVYSDAKAGKTLLLWEIVLALVSGKPVLGNPERDPLSVLYVDKENTRKDIREKFGKMGYEGEPLDGLHYYSFPELSYLDTEDGGRELYALARHHDVRLVVLDTLSRVVEGNEQENDTYHNFYKYTGVKLKADGIAVVRLDHAGKDRSKGMRGASSKTTDVDEVWELFSDDEGEWITLTRTHSRSYHGVNRLTLHRQDDPLRHDTEFTPGKGKSVSEGIEVELDLAKVPLDKTDSYADTWWRENGEKEGTGYSREQVREAQRNRVKEAKNA